MELEIEKYERIEKFLSGSLPGEELKPFEELIASDPLFALEIEQHRRIFNFVYSSTYAEIKAQISAIHEKKIKKIRKRNLRIKLGAGIVIGLAILCFVLYLTLNDNKQKENTKQPTPSIREKSPANNSISSITEPKIIKRNPVGNTSNIKNKVEIKNEEEPVEIIVHEKLLTQDKVNQLIQTNENNLIPRAIGVDGEIPGTGSDLEDKSVNDQLSPVAFDCSEISIFADVTAEKSCENEPTGLLFVKESSISGGTKPYKLSIDNQVSYHSTLYYNTLPPERYSVWISDSNDCRAWLGIFTIEPVRCGYKDIFAPEKGEKWEIPNKGLACKVWIYDQSGVLVFEANYDFPGLYLWDGYNTSGAILPMGAYSFILKCQDESVLKGVVTIVR
jgi:hypothetical protein